MEQHPVPQNITSFQFRLIGDMTIKQFGYLAGGIILAFIFYKLPLPFFFTWPLAILSAFTGFGFAFIPIEERPMDIWVLSFLKNVYSPTIYHWEHTDPVLEPPKSLIPPPPKIPTFAVPKLPLIQTPQALKTVAPTTPTTKPNASTPSHPPQPITAPQSVGKKPTTLDSFFFFIDNLFVAKPKPQPAYVVTQRPKIMPATQPTPLPIQPPPSVQPVPPMPSVTGIKIDVPKESPQKEPATQTNKDAPTDNKAVVESNLTELQEQLAHVQNELQKRTNEDARILDLQKQLTDLLSERQLMEKELSQLRAKAASIPPPTPQKTRLAGEVPTPSEPTVKTMTQEVATRAGLPRLTTFPNVVTGIIKDYDNNLLPGVLVTVKDKDGVPLRALKTNKLGQFAASTQLQNGTYVVEVEDPRERFVFDRVQISMNGTVLPALQIIAKSKRMIDREKLEKEIFGTPNAST